MPLRVHSLLRRQLKQCFASVDELPAETRAFVEAVEAAYRQADVDRTMLERSLELTSQELNEANANLQSTVSQLHDAHRDLETRIQARTKELAEVNASLNRKILEYEVAEKALKGSEERFSKAFRANSVAIVMVDLQTGVVIDANDRALDLLECTRLELLGAPSGETLLVAHALSEICVHLRERRSIREQEFVVKTDNGRTRQTLVAAEIIDLHGQPSALIMLQDVTQARLLEAQLRQAQKMESIGRLAGGVAHDFNNLLTIMFGYTDVLLDSGLDGDQRESVEAVRKAAESAAALTRQLLAFSRQQILAPKIFKLNELVEGVRQLIGRLLGEHIELIVRLEPNAGSVRVDPGQLQQVLLNLIVNAVDAMPHGGTLSVSTARRQCDEEFAALHVGAGPGEYLALAVSDTGIGMNADVKARIFEPFFTTKEIGRGTGLGLATVYGIVRQSEGFADCSSEPGRGTTFTVFLPKVQDQEAERESGRAPAPPSATGTILVVEDQDGVRRIACEWLRRQGYAVVHAKDGIEALEKAEQVPRIDLLLTDIVMPRLNGSELAARLTTLRPQLKVLYMTGYIDDASLVRQVRESRVPILQKPFAATSLLEHVREILQTG